MRKWARARTLSVDRMVEWNEWTNVGSKWQAREFYNTYSQHVTSSTPIHTYAICAHCSTCNSKFNFIAFVSFHLISISYSSYPFTRCTLYLCLCLLILTSYFCYLSLFLLCVCSLFAPCHVFIYVSVCELLVFIRVLLWFMIAIAITV